MINNDQILLHICESLQAHHNQLCELSLGLIIVAAQSGVSPEVIASLAATVRVICSDS